MVAQVCNDLFAYFDAPDTGKRNNRIQDIGLGVLATIAEMPLVSLIEKAVCSLMSAFELDLSHAQEVIQIWEWLNTLPLLVSGLFKTALFGYIVFVGPIIEEFLFRGVLHEWLQMEIEDGGYLGCALRVFANGLLFGACHLSPFQGWTNVPIFLVTFVMGCVFATLRETTGGLTASTTTHILHNGIAMTRFLI